jgi:glycosyltransferase involved in cell wall biosynthesis
VRILLVVDYAVPIGGAEVSTLLLRDALRARGHDVRVFASTAHRDDAESFADYACLGTTGPLRTLLQTCNPWAFVGLRRALRAFRPDVVCVGLFLTQLSPLILPLLRGVPAVHRAHWRRTICPLGTKQLPDGSECASPWGRACLAGGCLPARDWLPLMLQMRLWRRWRGAFDVVLANSAMVARSLAANGVGPVGVAHGGVRLGPPRGPLGDPPVAVFTGRLVRKKGADVLLRAFARVRRELPEARLVVVGDGPERRGLERLARALGLGGAVTMCGRLSRDDAADRLEGAWVQVVPSRYQEPFGIVILEAMARGTVVVASRAGGIPEIVRDGETGLLVPPGDEEALAGALLAVLGDRALAERLGRAGRRVAGADFSPDAYVAPFLEAFDRLVDRHAAASVVAPAGSPPLAAPAASPSSPVAPAAPPSPPVAAPSP